MNNATLLDHEDSRDTRDDRLARQRGQCAVELSRSDAPRLPDGTVNVKAPPLRTATGTVDLSGLWQTDVKYDFNLAADLKPGDVDNLAPPHLVGK